MDNQYINDNRMACNSIESPIRNVCLAHAYVPFQKLCRLFTPIESLMKGTAFPELFSPYAKREFAEPEKCPKCYRDRGGYRNG